MHSNTGGNFAPAEGYTRRYHRKRALRKGYPNRANLYKVGPCTGSDLISGIRNLLEGSQHWCLLRRGSVNIEILRIVSEDTCAVKILCLVQHIKNLYGRGFSEVLILPADLSLNWTKAKPCEHPLLFNSDVLYIDQRTRFKRKRFFKNRRLAPSTHINWEKREFFKSICCTNPIHYQYYVHMTMLRHTRLIGSCLESQCRVCFPLKGKMILWRMKYPLVVYSASGMESTRSR